MMRVKIPELSSSIGRGVCGETADSDIDFSMRRNRVGGGQLSNNPPVLKAPFPYPGGKSKIADTVWNRFGDVDNYVEPFAGSLAVLLRRPAGHFAGGYRVETCNDADGFICNFWRAVRADPDKVAEYADWPVLEADLHARHKWLMRSDFAKDWRKRMAEDPDHFDAKIAGWWCWGLCCWIGSGWCSGETPGAVKHPVITNPSPFGHGCNQSHGHPHSRPQLTDAFDLGRGVNGGAGELSRQRPDLAGGNSSAIGGVAALPQMATTDARRAWLTDWMRRIADRLRLVRTCYGHWSRICDSDSTLTRLGTTGVFLDPPYPSKKADGTKSRDDSLYTTDKTQDLDALRDEVLVWCRKWGEDPKIRVAVCGYEGDGYEALGWDETAWETGGGYANQRRGGKAKNENAKRERIWWSPACVKEKDLFSTEAA